MVVVVMQGPEDQVWIRCMSSHFVFQRAKTGVLLSIENEPASAPEERVWTSTRQRPRGAGGDINPPAPRSLSTPTWVR